MGHSTLMLRQIDFVFVTQFVRKMESIELPATKKKGETRKKNYSSETKNKIILAFRTAFNRAVENVSKERRHMYASAFDDIKLYKKEAHSVDSVPVPLIRKLFSYWVKENTFFFHAINISMKMFLSYLIIIA